MDAQIKYTDGYKYQLTKTYTVKVNIYPKKDIHSTYISLTRQGNLTIFRGYAWDGPSGPAPDFKRDMRAALVHDALYYPIRMGALDMSFKRAADDELYRIMVEDGASKWRARLYRWAVVKFGGRALKPRKIHSF